MSRRRMRYLEFVVTGQGMVSGLLAKVVNEMVINLHEEQIYNFMIKRDQNELQLSMVEITEKCNYISDDMKFQDGIIFHTLWKYKINHNKVRMCIS